MLSSLQAHLHYPTQLPCKNSLQHKASTCKSFWNVLGLQLPRGPVPLVEKFILCVPYSSFWPRPCTRMSILSMYWYYPVTVQNVCLFSALLLLAKLQGSVLNLLGCLTHTRRMQMPPCWADLTEMLQRLLCNHSMANRNHENFILVWEDFLAILITNYSKHYTVTKNWKISHSAVG